MGAWAGGVTDSVSSISISIVCPLTSLEDHVSQFIEGRMHKDIGLPRFKIRAEPPEAWEAGIAAFQSINREHHNKGNFTRVFDMYKREEKVTEGQGPYTITGGYACCILAVHAMSVGADISNDQRDYLRSIYKKCGMHKEGIEQIGRALDEYENGKIYTLIEPDDTDNRIRVAFEVARKKALPKTFLHVNYYGPQYYEEGVPTPHDVHISARQGRRSSRSHMASSATQCSSTDGHHRRRTIVLAGRTPPAGMCHLQQDLGAGP